MSSIFQKKKDQIPSVKKTLLHLFYLILQNNDDSVNEIFKSFPIANIEKSNIKHSEN